MELARTVAVITPESTALEFELAGPGSRFAALLVDTLYQTAMLAGIAVVAVVPLGLARGWPAVTAWTVRHIWPLAWLAAWLVFWGYYVGFETAWNGQTPGKRALGLRVIGEGGHAVNLGTAALRNILRYVDLLPMVAPYLLGAVVMTLNPRFRRVGDQVAGTLVIRERPTPWIESLIETPETAATTGVHLTAAQLERVTAEEVEVISEFLRRRDGLPLEARRSLATKIAERLRERLDSPRGDDDHSGADEDWLEAVQVGWMARRKRL